MNPPASIIRQWLIDRSLATASGAWPVFASFFPPTPDEAICVFDTVGQFDGRLMATGEAVGHPGIQIRVRAKEYQEAFSKAHSIASLIDEVRKVEVELSTNEYLVHNISRKGSFIPLGVEEDGGRRRYHITINGLLTLSIRESGEWIPYAVIGGG